MQEAELTASDGANERAHTDTWHRYPLGRLLGHISRGNPDHPPWLGGTVRLLM